MCASFSAMQRALTGMRCQVSPVRRGRWLPVALLAVGLIACTPRPIETLVDCQRLPASICDQLTPVVIGNVDSSDRSSVVEIRIECSVEECTSAEGAYRAWVRFAAGSERELPTGEWASG